MEDVKLNAGIEIPILGFNIYQIPALAKERREVQTYRNDKKNW